MVSQRTQLLAFILSAGAVSAVDEEIAHLDGYTWCPHYQDRESCLAARDHRSYWESACGWCCGDDCGGGDGHRCEPTRWLTQSGEAPFENAIGHDTCSGAAFHVDTNGHLKFGPTYVCDDNFTEKEARMVCAELGMDYGRFETSMDLPQGAVFTMDQLNCPPGATTLDDCTYDTTHDCSRYEGIHLYCSAPFSIDFEGRLKYKDGFVCDDSFSEHSARMICDELGLYYESHGDAYLPAGSRDFAMDELRCPEGAKTLTQCTHQETHDCWEWEGVRLTCTDDIYEFTQTDCSEGFEHITTVQDCRAAAIEQGPWNDAKEFEDVSLSSGSYDNCMWNPSHVHDRVALTNRVIGTITQPTCSSYGFNGCFCKRVDADTFSLTNSGVLKYNGGYVCDDMFGEDEGRMVCATLGLRYDGHSTRRTVPEANYSMDNLNCPTGATHLDECSYWENHNCNRHEAVQLTCTTDKFSLNFGRLKFNDGYVCDDGFGEDEGRMVCATLGLRYDSHRAQQMIAEANFSMDELNCPAGATTLAECSYEESHDCARWEAVQLTCRGLRRLEDDLLVLETSAPTEAFAPTL